MNAWLLAAMLLMAGLLPLIGWASRRSFRDTITAVAMASLLTTLALVLLTQAFARPPFIDLALVLAFLSFAAAITYARFLEGGFG